MLTGIKVSKMNGIIELFDITKIIGKYTTNIYLDFENILIRAYEYRFIDYITSNKEYKLNLYKKGEIKTQKTKNKITTIKAIKNKLQNISSTFQRLLI